MPATINPWSEEDVVRLIAGERSFPGRTQTAIRRKLEHVRANRPDLPVSSGQFWRPEEIAALQAGARSLPGRSQSSVNKKRMRLAPEIRPHLQPRWKPDEIEAIIANPKQTPQGRTLSAVHDKLRGLGLSLRSYRIARPAIIRRDTSPFKGSVFAAASERSHGYDLMREITSHVPARMAPSLREEILSEAVLISLDQGLDPKSAVSHAMKRVSAFSSGRFASISFEELVLTNQI